MNLNTDLIATLTRQNVILPALGAAFLLAMIAIWRLTATKSKGTSLDTILNAIVTTMILALSAEGMYVMLTQKIDNPIPAYLAWAVCSGVEGLLVILFREAKRFYTDHKRPGPYGTAFWIVAAAGGTIVALSTSSPFEILLRLALPLSVAMLHWIRLTAGTSTESKVTWLITPTRLLARIGWLTAGEETLSQAQISRQTDKLVAVAYLLSREINPDGKKSPAHKRQSRRLSKMMLKATPAIAAEVEKRIALAYSMERRIQSAVLNGQQQLQQLGDQQQSQQTNNRPTPVLSGPVQRPETTTIPQLTAPARRIEAPTQRPALPAGRAAVIDRDNRILDRYRATFHELYKQGRLTRTRIETVCTERGDKVTARQANRLLAAVEEELA